MKACSTDWPKQLFWPCLKLDWQNNRDGNIETDTLNMEDRSSGEWHDASSACHRLFIGVEEFQACKNLIGYTRTNSCMYINCKFFPVLNPLSTMPWRHIGKWRYSSTILGLTSRWRWVVGFMFQLLYPWGKSPWYSLNRMLGEPQSRSGCYGEEKNLVPARNGTLTVQPVARYCTDWDIPTFVQPYLYCTDVYTSTSDLDLQFLQELHVFNL
jgi:hypothetical protein